MLDLYVLGATWLLTYDKVRVIITSVNLTSWSSTRLWCFFVHTWLSTFWWTMRWVGDPLYVYVPLLFSASYTDCITSWNEDFSEVCLSYICHPDLSWNSCNVMLLTVPDSFSEIQTTLVWYKTSTTKDWKLSPMSALHKKRMSWRGHGSTSPLTYTACCIANISNLKVGGHLC